MLVLETVPFKDGLRDDFRTFGAGFMGFLWLAETVEFVIVIVCKSNAPLLSICELDPAL